MTETTGRRVRIENRNPEGKKILSGGRITIDGEDISNHVMAVDIHMDGKSLPTARLELVDLEVDIDAVEAEPEDATPNDASSIEEKIDAILQQLGILLGVVIQCAACVADARQGGNPQVNLANVIVGGEGLCHTHVDLVGTRLVRRNSSGLIIGGN